MKRTIAIISMFLLVAGIAAAQKTSPKTSFKDSRDGQVYGIKKLGKLTWMKENLRYDFPDKSWCYDDEEDACEELGMLYTFDGALKACPTGWRLPTDNDWMDLEKSLGMPQNQLMVDGYSTARGYRESLMLQVGGNSGLDFKISGFATFGKNGATFDGIGGDRPRSYFWTSTGRTINGQRNVYRRRIEANSGMIYRFSNPEAGYAVSVRCVQ
ncbi:MAG: FISUMP domain-containing protein [Pyrinomonadaceae bacterium]